MNLKQRITSSLGARSHPSSFCWFSLQPVFQYCGLLRSFLVGNLLIPSPDDAKWGWNVWGCQNAFCAFHYYFYSETKCAHYQRVVRLLLMFLRMPKNANLRLKRVDFTPSKSRLWATIVWGCRPQGRFYAFDRYRHQALLPRMGLQIKKNNYEKYCGIDFRSRK